MRAIRTMLVIYKSCQCQLKGVLMSLRSAMGESSMPKSFGTSERVLQPQETSGVIVTTPYVPLTKGSDAKLRSGSQDPKFQATTTSVSKASAPKSSPTRSAMAQNLKK